MSNSIFWGVIYCNTWFGQIGETTTAIPNYSATPCFAPSIATDFQTRVNTDSGTLEAYNCLTNELFKLNRR